MYLSRRISNRVLVTLIYPQRFVPSIAVEDILYDILNSTAGVIAILSSFALHLESKPGCGALPAIALWEIWSALYLTDPLTWRPRLW